MKFKVKITPAMVYRHWKQYQFNKHFYYDNEYGYLKRPKKGKK